MNDFKKINLLLLFSHLLRPGKGRGLDDQSPDQITMMGNESSTNTR